MDKERWLSEDAHYHELQTLTKRNKCYCGGFLNVVWLEGKYHLRCENGHLDEATVREPTSWELWLKGELDDPYIAEKIRKRWRKQMEETGLTKAQIEVLEEARRTPVTSLSERQTLTLAQVLWPDAPEEAQRRAALLCQMYGLNPLLKQVALIKFHNRTTGKDTWEPILSMDASRIIAKRSGAYSYVDGPRIMTDDEQRVENGEVDDETWWAITVIQDMQGNRAHGVGSWVKKGEPNPYGEDKGNTRQNMAKIRSERQATKRLRPAELPTEVEVIDAEFIELAVPQAIRQQAKALPLRTEPRPAGIPPNLVMKTPMDLFGASKRYFNLEQKQVLADLNLTTVQELADVGEAWATIVALHTGPPEGA